jgi:SNF2 family DNA or RNA helicase
MTFNLYDFQKEDVEKLAEQRGAMIGTEMGAGKTHEGIALDELWNPKAEKPTLVVAPLRTHSSWQEKYGRQSPSTDVVLINRKNRGAFVDAIGRPTRTRRGDVFVMHWDALRLLKGLSQVPLGVLIADEAHRGSNRKAQATQHLRRLRAEHRLAMSGTLTGDKPEGIQQILKFIRPGDLEFSSYDRFIKKYTKRAKIEDPSGDTSGYTRFLSYEEMLDTDADWYEPDMAEDFLKHLRELHERIAPYYVRHLKHEQCCEHHPEGVMPWLPEKTYDMMWVDLNPTQKRMYDQMRKDMVAWVGEHEASPLVASVVVAQMTRLSQIALATPRLDTTFVRKRDMEEGGWLINPDTNDEYWEKEVVNLEEPSSKIDAVTDLIRDNGSKQFVVYSSSKKACYLAQSRWENLGISTRVISGDSSEWDNQHFTTSFANGDFQVCIGVIEAIAEGVDGLQYATDTGIFLDRSWKTVKNIQAEDRLWRDGQANAVQIIDVMARGTLDFGRKTKLGTKWSAIKRMLGDPSALQQEAAQHYFDEEEVA